MNRRILVLTIATPLILGALEPNKTADVHYSYPMQPGSRLTVENMNGSIQISAWDQNTIDISATNPQAVQKRANKLIKQLRSLGYQVQIQPVAVQGTTPQAVIS